MSLSEFRKEDYWLIKWPLLSLTLSLCCAGGLIVGLTTLDASATAELRRAQTGLDTARNSVAKIEEEESTIIEYIDRYRVLEEEGIVSDEDRLQLQENVLEMRTAFKLFEVLVNLSSQSGMELAYPPEVSDPGRPITLHFSEVELSLALLHENDLARLLTAVLERPGLLQPVGCSLKSSGRPATGFIYLAQHFNATCTLQWYTIALPPPEPVEVIQ
jgi:hypothetical protein